MEISGKKEFRKFINTKNWLEHLASKAHTKRFVQIENKSKNSFCTPCRKRFQNEHDLNTHRNSAYHKFRKFEKTKVQIWNCNELGYIQCTRPHRQMTRNVHRAFKKKPRNDNRIVYEVCQFYDKDQSDSEEDPFKTPSDEYQGEPSTYLVHQIDYAEPENEQFDSLDLADF